MKLRIYFVGSETPREPKFTTEAAKAFLDQFQRYVQGSHDVNIVYPSDVPTDRTFYNFGLVTHVEVEI